MSPTERTRPAVGTRAPDFMLPDQFGQQVRLSDLLGRQNIVVVFFPYAFTPTCTSEVRALQDQSADFVTADVTTLAISCDPGPTLKVFAEQQDIGFPLLSDFWPHGAVARAYGVFHPERGFAQRGTFVLDCAGIVRWSVLNAIPDARSTDDYRAALRAL